MGKRLETSRYSAAIPALDMTKRRRWRRKRS
jgi:hypothetical protein